MKMGGWALRKLKGARAELDAIEFLRVLLISFALVVTMIFVFFLLLRMSQ